MTDLIIFLPFEEPLLEVAHAMAGVEVGPPGHAVEVAWTPASGATAAELTAGELRIGTASTTVAIGALGIGGSGGPKDLTVPGGRRVSSVALSGLALTGGGELRSEADLDAARDDSGALRLVISTQVGGAWTPLCVVPDPGGRGVLPSPFRGARLRDGVLDLPDPAAAQLRLQLVRGDTPESFAGRSTELTAAHATAAVVSAGLQLTGPDGAVLWAFPGELPAAGQTVDLRTPLKLALDAALDAGAAPSATLRLTGGAGMRAVVDLTAPHGALLRTVPGTVSVDLAGWPVALPVAGPPLAAEAPGSAVADVAVRYTGVRLHDAVRDPGPPDAGGVSGLVVGSSPVVRVLPPAALRDHPVALAGPVGRSPEGCSLSVELVDLASGPPGVPMGPPGTLELAPGEALAAPWVALPEQAPSGARAGVSVRTTSGRFLWAAGPDGVPLLRLAVRDPDPGGRAVRLGAATLTAVSGRETTLPACALPAAALRGPAAPTLSSDLFCAVELADLTLRYPR